MLDKIKSLLRTLGFSKAPPLETKVQLIDFIDSRAAYVSQVTLYTYVKARSGTQHPKLFENEAFLTSLRIARWHIFGAAVADLALFSAAQMVRSGPLSDRIRRRYRLRHGDDDRRDGDPQRPAARTLTNDRAVRVGRRLGPRRPRHPTALRRCRAQPTRTPDR